MIFRVDAFIMRACILSRFSCVRLFATLWTVANQASLSREFSRQEYWSGLPCSPPGDLPDTGIEPSLLRLSVLANGFFLTTTATWKAPSYHAAAAAKSRQSCPTLCDPIDVSPPGSSVPGILQARTLGWGAISFSNAWKWKGKVKSLSRVWLLVTPWTAAYQAPLSMGFPRQEYWSGVPWPSLLVIMSSVKIRVSQLPQRWRTHLPMQDTWVQSLGGEDPLEKRIAIHSSILAQSQVGFCPWGCKTVGHNWSTKTRSVKPKVSWEESCNENSGIFPTVFFTFLVHHRKHCHCWIWLHV